MELLRKGNVFTTYLVENSIQEKVVLKLINCEYLNDK